MFFAHFFLYFFCFTVLWFSVIILHFSIILFSDFSIYSHFIFQVNNRIIVLYACSIYYRVGSNITFQIHFTRNQCQPLSSVTRGKSSLLSGELPFVPQIVLAPPHLPNIFPSYFKSPITNHKQFKVFVYMLFNDDY